MSMGVCLFLSFALMSAPLLMRSRRESILFVAAARCNGVFPSYVKNQAHVMSGQEWQKLFQQHIAGFFPIAFRFRFPIADGRTKQWIHSARGIVLMMPAYHIPCFEVAFNLHQGLDSIYMVSKYSMMQRGEARHVSSFLSSRSACQCRKVIP